MVESKKRKRVLTEEDIFYIQKIQVLANKRLRLYRKQELLEQQAKETNKLAIVISKPKRPRSMSTEEDDHKKKKIPPKIARTLLVTDSTTDRLKEELLEQQAKETNKSTTTYYSKRKRPRSTSDNHKKKKIAPKIVRMPLVTNEATDRLNKFIVNELRGTDIKVVIQKTVYKSDTRKGLNRLNMPLNQLEKGEFLTANERQIINKRTPKENEIEVLLLGPTLKMYRYPMKLKIWHMVSSANYVLTTNWHRFWSENKVQLREQAKIQVWSFRRDQQLCFAVVCVGEQNVEDYSPED